MLKLQRWDIKMEWTKGKDLHIPGTLSRAYLKESKDDSELDEEIKCHVNAVLEEIPVSQTMWKKIASHTEADIALQKGSHVSPMVGKKTAPISITITAKS